jgi:uncharacterized protein YegL
LNSALPIFKQELEQDSTARLAVELAIVTFGGPPQKILDWTAPDAFNPPTLTAGGDTPLGNAIHMALDMLEERNSILNQTGIGNTVPWIVIMTDGAPNIDPVWYTAIQRVQEAIANKSAIAFAISTDPTRETAQLLHEITPRLFQLKNMAFRELFIWLSKGLKSASESRGAKTQIPIPPPDVRLADALTIGG